MGEIQQSHISRSLFEFVLEGKHEVHGVDLLLQFHLLHLLLLPLKNLSLSALSLYKLIFVAIHWVHA